MNMMTDNGNDYDDHHEEKPCDWSLPETPRTKIACKEADSDNLCHSSPIERDTESDHRHDQSICDAGAQNVECSTHHGQTCTQLLPALHNTK